MKLTLSRRNTIAGLAAVTSLASIPAIAAAPPDCAADPVLKLLADYQDGMARFEQIKEADWPAFGGEQAVIAQTWLPPFEAIEYFEGRATTRAGAVAALKQVLKETADFCASPLIAPLVDAALGYLEAMEA